MWTKKLHESKKRWTVAVCHRRAGKTVASLNHLIRDAIQKPNSKYAYIAPTYKQAKNIAWDILKAYARKVSGVSFNESELRADFGNGSRITLYGADNPDSLRGMGLHGVVFDEYSQQPSNIFSEIIRPALSDHKGYAIWIGTPKGRNEFYRLYAGLDKEGNLKTDKELDKWERILLTVKNSGLIDDEELEDSRSTMTEDEYQQEWYCSFDAAIKGAYYANEIARCREENRITKVTYDNRIPVYTFWDLGISDDTTILFVQRVGSEIRIIDTYSNSGLSLNHYIKYVLNKEYIYADHYAPHDIEVRELGTGISRLELAKKLGIRFRIIPKLSIEDGINATRVRFQHFWIDDKQTDFIDAISQYKKEWDDKKGMFRDKPYHDWSSHYADTLRYLSIGSNETNKKNQFGNINKQTFK